jgi:hypothetical protein
LLLAASCQSGAGGPPAALEAANRQRPTRDAGSDAASSPVEQGAVELAPTTAGEQGAWRSKARGGARGARGDIKVVAPSRPLVLLGLIRSACPTSSASPLSRHRRTLLSSPSSWRTRGSESDLFFPRVRPPGEGGLSSLSRRRRRSFGFRARVRPREAVGAGAD